MSTRRTGIWWRLCWGGVVLFLQMACNNTPKGYVELGNRQFGEGKYEEAVLNYRKALQRDGKYGEAAYRLGKAYLAMNQPREAMDALAQAVELSPQLEEARVALADLALTVYLQSPERPQFLYDRLTKLSEEFRRRSDSYQAWRIEGFLRMTDGRMEESVQAFERALAAKPGDPDVTLALTKPLLELGRYAEVERKAQGVLAMHPSFGPLYDVLYVLYLTQNRRPEAEQLIQRKVKENPGQAEFAVQLCRHYAATKQFEALSAEIKRLLQDTKNYPDGRLRVTEFYSQEGNWREAESVLEEGIRRDPERRRQYQAMLLKTLVALGKTAEALQTAEAMLKENPKAEAALTTRGVLNLVSGKRADLELARQDFEGLVALNPRDPVHRFRLGRVRHMQGDVVGAQQEYVESAKLRRGYLPPRMALAEIRFDQRQYAEALRLLEGVLVVDGRNPRVRVMHAATQMGLGQTDRAKAELEQVLREFPGYPTGEVQMAFLLLKEKKYAEAERVFQRQRDGPDRFRALQGLVAVHEEQKQGEAALALLQGELNKFPEARQVRDLTAGLAIRLNRFDVALDTYRPVVEKAPGSADVQMRYGEIYRMKGDFAAALACYEKAAKLEPKNANIRSMLGYVYGTTGQFSEARKHLEQARALSPADAGILNNLANVLVESGAGGEDALKYAREALEKSPRNPELRDTLGWAYAQAGNVEAARQILENLTKEHPQNPTYRYHLGYVLLKKGDRTGAKQQFEIALANQPTPREQTKIRELLAQAN